jgi:hypothetical protein
MDLSNGSGPTHIVVHYEEGKEGANGSHWFYPGSISVEEHMAKHGITEYYVFPNVPPPEKWVKWEDHLHMNPNECHLYKMAYDENNEKYLTPCTIKCKQYFANEMRPERNAALAKLDGEYMKLHEKGMDTSDVIRRKNILRDMPTSTRWDMCETVDDFKNLTLDDIILHADQPDPAKSTQ